MTGWIKSLAIIGFMAAALPVAAQDSGTAADAASTLPLGEAAGVPPGQPFEKEVFRDWRIVCVQTTDGVETCNMQQLAVDSQGNPVAQMSVVPLPADAAPRAAAVEVVAPLETLLSGDVRVQVDDGDERVYRFTFCNGDACFARFAFTVTEIEALKAGGEAFIRIVPLVAPDQVATVRISLRGFTAAYDSLAPN